MDMDTKQNDVIMVDNNNNNNNNNNNHKLPENELIEIPYAINDLLEVLYDDKWIVAEVIHKENNCIVVSLDRWPKKYDQKIPFKQHKERLRALGSGLPKTQDDKDIEEEMNYFLSELESLHYKLHKIDADGNCLYRCFAKQIYGDSNKHLKVRKECCKNPPPLNNNNNNSNVND